MDPARDPGSDARSVLRRRPHQPAAFARKQSWLRPPRTLRPTRAGWAFFALTFGVGFAALNTGNNLLYLVLALMLAFLILSGVLSESALRGIQVRRRLPGELYAERETRVGLEITNDQRRASALAVVVEDRVAERGEDDRSAGRAFALRISPGASELRSYALRPERRGRLEFQGFVVSTRFPFGLFSKALRIEAPETARIYPAIDSIPAPRRQEDPRREGESRTRETRGASPVASGLRDYTPGDPRRRVNWRASLRRGSLLVRELESECDEEARVRLRTAGERPGEGFERRVRRAASEIVAHLEAGRRVALGTDERDFPAGSDPTHRARLLGFLADVSPELGSTGAS
jgi:uncharacterized protein (DUF58 family)